MEKTKYNSIDLYKLIMAFCVVAIHTCPLNNYKNEIVLAIYNSFVDIAVPFFFLASGFLLANKFQYPFDSDNNIQYIRNYLLRIIKLYVMWSLIYLPLAIWHYISTQTNVIKSVLSYIRGFVFIGEHYNSWPLWYLLSTIYALALIIFLLKRKSTFKTISRCV